MRILCLCLLASAGTACADLQLSGFVDASMLAQQDPKTFAFSMDQFELDLQRLQNGFALLRADLDFVDDGAGGWTMAVEQAFVTLPKTLVPWTTLSFGRFNAPVGFEALDAPEMFQYSHALVFDYGLPTNYTGLKAQFALNSNWEFLVVLGNSWDANTEVDLEKTYAGRLSGHFSDFVVGLSWIADPEVVADDSQIVWDLDATYSNKAWTAGFEFNYGTYTGADGKKLDWQGFLLMSHYDFNKTLGLTLRFDSFDDSDGLRLGESVGVKRQAITVATTFVLGEKMGALIEFRQDMLDKSLWLDDKGQSTDQRSQIAAEITFGF